MCRVHSGHFNCNGADMFYSFFCKMSGFALPHNFFINSIHSLRVDFISPGEDTPEGLVKIDFYTGQISVDENGAIDADVPRWELFYTIIASDKCYAENTEDCPPDPTYWDTEGKVSP